MVDVSGKKPSLRTAVARGKICMSPDVLRALEEDLLPKGDVAATAVVAGIQAVKKTAELIPMCHLLELDSVDIDLEPCRDGMECTCTVRAHARTGFEMEALTGVSIALLTVLRLLCRVFNLASSVETVIWGTMIMARMPKIITTTSISIKVNPDWSLSF